MAILGSGRRNATVTASTRVELLVLFGTVFRTMESDHPDLAELIRQKVAARARPALTSLELASIPGEGTLTLGRRSGWRGVTLPNRLVEPLSREAYFSRAASEERVRPAPNLPQTSE